METNYTTTDDLPEIFEGVGIVPSQYGEMRRKSLTSEGELKLLFAVLEDAIRCYLRNAGEASVPRPESVEAEQWLGSDEESGPFAFVSICDALGINAGRLRSGIWNYIGRLKRAAPDASFKL